MYTFRLGILYEWGHLFCKIRISIKSQGTASKKIIISNCLEKERKKAKILKQN